MILNSGEYTRAIGVNYTFIFTFWSLFPSFPPADRPLAPQAPLSAPAGLGGSDWGVGLFGMAPVKMEERERRNMSMQILKLLCDSPLLQEHLIMLLSER